MLAVMIAPTVGINPLTPSFIFTTIAIVALSSFGVAGVSGLKICRSFLQPLTYLSEIGSFVNFHRAINRYGTYSTKWLSGSMTSGILTSRIIGEIDSDMYGNMNEKIEAEV